MQKYTLMLAISILGYTSSAHAFYFGSNCLAIVRGEQERCTNSNCLAMVRGEQERCTNSNCLAIVRGEQERCK